VKREDIRLKVLSDPRMLCAIRGLIRGYTKNLGLAAERAEEVVLAVDEACTNSMRHSYEGRTDGLLEITLRSDAEAIEIVLRDRGRPAPKELVKPGGSSPVNAGTLKPGGLGLQLIRRVFDGVSFRPGREKGNCLLMRLDRSREGEPSQGKR